MMQPLSVFHIFDSFLCLKESSRHSNGIFFISRCLVIKPFAIAIVAEVNDMLSLRSYGYLF